MGTIADFRTEHNDLFTYHFVIVDLFQFIFDDLFWKMISFLSLFFFCNLSVASKLEIILHAAKRAIQNVNT